MGSLNMKIPPRTGTIRLRPFTTIKTTLARPLLRAA